MFGSKKSLALKHRTKLTQNAYRILRAGMPTLSSEYGLEQVRKDYKKLANYKPVDNSYIVLENMEETVHHFKFKFIILLILRSIIECHCAVQLKLNELF
jgi:hypothetical protein